MYSKAAVLESLLEAGKAPEGKAESPGELNSAASVKSLRDVVEVRFQSEEVDDDEKFKSSTTPRWVCPITNKRLGPGVKAIYFVPCGHAFTETAIKEMPGENCLQVGMQVVSGKIRYPLIYFSVMHPILPKISSPFSHPLPQRKNDSELVRRD